MSLRERERTWLGVARSVVYGTVAEVGVLRPDGTVDPVTRDTPHSDGPIGAPVVVVRRWKGPPMDSLLVAWTPSREAARSSEAMPLSKGERYLLFLDAPSPPCWSDRCTGSAAAPRADTLAAVLDSLVRETTPR